MKGFSIGPEVLIAVLIAIVALVWGVHFIEEGRFEGTSGGGEDISKCRYNSDCIYPELCISVEGKDYICGCLEIGDCAPGDTCVGNECVKK